MSRQVAWNKIILDEFIRIGELTDFEEDVIRTRVRGWSRDKQSIEFNVSLSAIDRAIKRLKAKYDNACKYSPILPARAKYNIFD